MITTPITFAASADCILYGGAKPVFADIQSTTYNISSELIRQSITKRIKAIIAVHYGQPCNMDEIRKIAKEHNLFVIEDGAHALSAEYKGKKLAGYQTLPVLVFTP